MKTILGGITCRACADFTCGACACDSYKKSSFLDTRRTSRAEIATAIARTHYAAVTVPRALACALCVASRGSNQRHEQFAPYPGQFAVGLTLIELARKLEFNVTFNYSAGARRPRVRKAASGSEPVPLKLQKSTVQLYLWCAAQTCPQDRTHGGAF